MHKVVLAIPHQQCPLKETMEVMVAPFLAPRYPLVVGAEPLRWEPIHLVLLQEKVETELRHQLQAQA
jgi:hypothetical protein